MEAWVLDTCMSSMLPYWEQGWHLVTNPNGLVARIFKAKYFPNDSFLSAKLGASPSFVWRSVLAAQHILRQGLGRRVGDGNSVQILNEPWLPSIDNPYVSTESTDIEGHTVSMLMAPNERKWDEDLVKHLFTQRDVNLILATPLSDNIEDSWYWRKEKSGNFSVKTAEAESTSHVLLDCSFARCCWEIVEVSTDDTPHTSFTEWALNVFDKWDATKRQIGAMLCWTIWNCRNNLIWNQKSTEVQEAVYSARMVLSQWKEAQDRFFDKSWGLLNPDDGDELWSPPNENKTKINTDAAVFEASNRYSFAFAARNHKGELIEARSSCKEGCITPECAEAMGIREALSWIKDEQLKDVVVETDCLVAVQAIRGREAMSSYFGILIQDCRNLLKEVKNKGVYLKFVKRSANNLAHAFASCSYSVADRIWRTNEVSQDIIHVLEQDLK
ncbi:uncharacterized protein LOC141665702 [Apium graveolens]|uniref:uncharacterized protein LOC141665702 n=1 Tax=Apium graveolens TaxID=4045 RepID=UPI003D7AE0B3